MQIQAIGKLLAILKSEDERLGREFKGFSISIVTPHYENPESHLDLALSFPHYNDPSLLSSLVGLEQFTISKWRKKAATPDNSAILVAFVILILKPVWEDVYENIVKPSLVQFGKAAAKILISREIPLEFCQNVVFDERLIELRFLPDGIIQRATDDEDHLLKAIRESKIILEANRQSVSKVTRLVFRYDQIGRKFSILRTDFDDGVGEHQD